MAIKRRIDKKRAALTDDAIAFLEGRPSFTQFKGDAYLADLWEKYGDTNVATWKVTRDRAQLLNKKQNPCSGLSRAGAVQRT